MKILFVTTSVPYPPDTGGKIRVYSLIRDLARRHEIGLICFEDAEPNPCAVQLIRELGIEIVTVPNLVRQHPATKRACQLLSLFSPYPFQRYRFDSPRMQQAIDTYLRTHDVDLVDVEFAQMAYYHFPPGLPVVLGQHNVEHEILRRSYQGASPSFRKFFNFMEWWKFRRDEIAACRRATLITTTSEHDRQELATHVPAARLRVIPNGVDTTYFQRATGDDPDPNTIVFTGLMNYYPNVDGLRYFVHDVLPLVRREYAAVKFYAVGRDPTPEVQSYNLMPGVVVTGPVADVRGFFERAAVAVVPLRFGGGTRLKILEAMAMGCPVVSTSAGAEGIEVANGENILIADDPAAISDAIVRLLRDAPLRARLAAAGRRLVEERYDWSSVARSLEDAYVEAYLAHARRAWSTAPAIAKSLSASGQPFHSVAAPIDQGPVPGIELKAGGLIGHAWPVARGLLDKVVNHHRFNDSPWFAVYLNLRYPRTVRRYRSGKSLYKRLLQSVNARLIFDIGANIGDKTLIFASLANKVVSVEPSPAAAQVLRERFLYNPKVVVVEKGVGATDGTSKFHLFGDVDYYNTFSPKWVEALGPAGAVAARPAKSPRAIVDVPITTLDQLIDDHGSPSYIKIDVEGYELAVLQGLTRRVPLLSFESNLPEFTTETLECLSILARRQPSAHFNFCTTEPPSGFESPRWLSHDEMADYVRDGSYPFMEIYCQSQ